MYIYIYIYIHSRESNIKSMDQYIFILFILRIYIVKKEMRYIYIYI